MCFSKAINTPVDCIKMQPLFSIHIDFRDAWMYFHFCLITPDRRQSKYVILPVEER